MQRNMFIILILALLIGFGVYQYAEAPASEPNVVQEAQSSEPPAIEDGAPVPASSSPENTVTFSCDAGKSLTAVFMRDIVGLTLSDGRQFELRQVQAASGARYENAYEKVAFYGDESGTSVTEGGEVTYKNCHTEP